MYIRGAVGYSTHRNKNLSRIIRWFTSHRFSHCFIIADTVRNRKISKKRIYILDAYKREVSYSTTRFYEEKDTEFEVWYPKDIAPEEIEIAFRKTELVFMKRRYSLLKLAGIAIKLLVQSRLGRIIKNPFDFGTHCAEMQLHYLNSLYPELFNHLERSTVSPSDLYDIVSTSGKFEKIHSKRFDE